MTQNGDKIHTIKIVVKEYSYKNFKVKKVLCKNLLESCIKPDSYILPSLAPIKEIGSKYPSLAYCTSINRPVEVARLLTRIQGLNMTGLTVPGYNVKIHFAPEQSFGL
jgi:hypothetical protein